MTQSDHDAIGAAAEKRPKGRRPGRRRGFTAAGVALAAASTFALATPAHAATGTYEYMFLHSHYGMYAGGNFPGAVLVHDRFDGNAPDMKWTTQARSDGTSVIVNQANGLCINTDGVSGHLLTLETCDSRWGEAWEVQNVGFAPPGPLYRSRATTSGWTSTCGTSSTSAAVLVGTPWNASASQELFQFPT